MHEINWHVIFVENIRLIEDIGKTWKKEVSLCLSNMVGLFSVSNTVNLVLSAHHIKVNFLFKSLIFYPVSVGCASVAKVQTRGWREWFLCVVWSIQRHGIIVLRSICVSFLHGGLFCSLFFQMVMSKSVRPKYLTDRQNFIRTDKHFIFLLHNLLLGLTRFTKSVQMTGMSKDIPTSLFLHKKWQCWSYVVYNNLKLLELCDKKNQSELNFMPAMFCETRYNTYAL